MKTTCVKTITKYAHKVIWNVSDECHKSQFVFGLIHIWKQIYSSANAQPYRPYRPHLQSTTDVLPAPCSSVQHSQRKE